MRTRFPMIYSQYCLAKPTLINLQSKYDELSHHSNESVKEFLKQIKSGKILKVNFESPQEVVDFLPNGFPKVRCAPKFGPILKRE